ncbi:alpha/beta-hydrolase [Microthyrium microscopicum]|uniref:Alpha/beta-hydrolase n=1 Tax=Microthyrium microscopicum TaxID=703497 RepID=A0A6A6U547_9PEZI|nr:alpha/beta-hydrolase [Microthyrium microscopicum]
MFKQLAIAALYATAALAQLPTVAHTGTPTGEEKVINGLNIYHAYAPSKSAEHAIIFLTDIFGLALPANKLLADSYARAGYLVLMPDYFKGDPQPQDRTGFNSTGWAARHPQAEIEQFVGQTVDYAKSLGVKKLGAAGFCFGGPYVVRILAGKGVDVGLIAHPGKFSDEELNAIKGPLSVAAAETDQSLPPARRHEVESLLQKKNATYQINLYSGVSHGFAVRIDLNDPKQVFAKESAFYQAKFWFDQWLKGGSPAKTGAAALKYSNNRGDMRIQHDFDYTS